MVCWFAVFVGLVGAARGDDAAKKSGQKREAVVNSVPSVRKYSGKIVDTPAMAARPRPSEEGVVYAYPYTGELVEVRYGPSAKAPVFAEFNGGAIVDVLGEPVTREDGVWVEVEFLEVRGWVPQERVKRTSENDWYERRWDIHFISPSGKVVVELANHSIGYLSVIRDGERDRYGLPLEPHEFMASGPVLFSRDENCIATAYGGASWGTEVFVFARDAKGEFVSRKANLQKRCWELLKKEKLVPAEAAVAHLYMAVERSLEDGFVVRFAGNYDGGDQRFGPYRFAWHAKGDQLKLEK
jgi:hypothetical protein